MDASRHPADEIPEDLERARQELRRQREALEADRRQFRQEQAQADADWQRRCDAAWEKLRQETLKVATEKQTLHRLRRETNGELEVGRRQLEASWSQLRREQQDWRDHKAREDARLTELARHLDGRRLALTQAEGRWAEQQKYLQHTHQARLQELGGLEQRIRGYCAKLASLREESARLETALCPPPADQPALTSEAISLPAIHLPEGPDDLLAFLTRAAQDLVDQSQHLLEQHGKMVALKEAWQAEWDQALVSLSRHAEELAEREEHVTAHEREMERKDWVAQQTAMELARTQQEFQCWEVRLARRQTAMEAEKGKLLATVRERVRAAREQRQLLLHLHRVWESRRRREHLHHNALLQSREAAREELLKIRDRYLRRLEDLDRRERDLQERDFILTMAQRQLVSNDPNPAGAEKELQRRLNHLTKITRKPLKGLERRAQELERRAEQLEAMRQVLIEHQKDQAERESILAEMQTTLEGERVNLAAERVRWQHDLNALRQEKQRLQQYAHDLQQQLERLTLLLMDTNRPEPPLALAA